MYKSDYIIFGHQLHENRFSSIIVYSLFYFYSVSDNDVNILGCDRNACALFDCNTMDSNCMIKAPHE